jgi:hypothetical protein
MYSSTLSLTSALDGGAWSTPRPRRFNPGKDPINIVYERGWASKPAWTGAEKLAHTGIRSPDRLARSKSLYRLLYPAPSRKMYNIQFDYIFLSCRLSQKISLQCLYISTVYSRVALFSVTSHNTLSMVLMQDTLQ